MSGLSDALSLVGFNGHAVLVAYAVMAVAIGLVRVTASHRRAE